MFLRTFRLDRSAFVIDLPGPQYCDGSLGSGGIIICPSAIADIVNIRIRAWRATGD